MTNVFEFYGPKRWKHQSREFRRSKDQEFWALLFEQRCGKTPVLIDTALYLYLQGKIDALIYISPSGVHADFVTDYLPVFVPPDIPMMTHVWRSAKARQPGVIRARQTLLAFSGLAVLTFNIDAVITKTARQFLASFFKERKAVLVAQDESLDISSPKAARTKILIRLGMLAKYRRILDGTPLDAGPLGVWSQFEFLKPGCLGFAPSEIKRGKLVMPGKWAFNYRYAEWEEAYVATHSFKRIVEDEDGKKKWKNLDELQKKIAQFSSVVVRADCADLPEKIYEKRRFELNEEQREFYEKLHDEFRVELDQARSVTATMVLTRYMRLQQVVSNFAPLDRKAEVCKLCNGAGCEPCEGTGLRLAKEQELIRVAKHDSRLETFDEIIRRLPNGDQFVVWARFRRDINLLENWCLDNRRSFVRYDGSIKDAEQLRINRLKFQKGDAQFILGNPVKGGRGTDFSRASAELYYSHMWSLRWRRQSEDRAQHLDKKTATLYLDLIAEDTIDEAIMEALKEGKELAELIMPRGKGKWL